MTAKCCQNLVPLKPREICGPITGALVEEINSENSPNNRRKCGCLKTSEKLKQILRKFPSSPPPTPMHVIMYDKASGYAYGHGDEKMPCMSDMPEAPFGCCKEAKEVREQRKSWKIVSDVVMVVQLSVTATALALYYLFYCYMQTVYYTLKSAMYFHNADGPMKVTIGVVTATALIIAFNILMRLEKILAIVY